MSVYLKIDHVSITFPTAKGPLKVLDDVTLDIAQGEFVSLIGHSGCGKSTVLNIVAGLLQASEGGVLLEEREVSDPGPDRAVVFQQHSLLPWSGGPRTARSAMPGPCTIWSWSTWVTPWTGAPGRSPEA